MVYLFISLIILFICLSLILTKYILSRPKTRDSLNIFKDGFKFALKDCGFKFLKDEYTVELYKWEIVENGDVCEECLRKSFLLPMDLADWMKEGMPACDADSDCEGACRCNLVLHEKRPAKQHRPS